jgi:hypothetical protein
MPASRNETADEPRIAEACQKRPADITAQVDDEAYPVEVMPVGEPRPQHRCACALRGGPLISLPWARSLR